VISIEYGKWTYCRSLLEEQEIRVPLDYVLGWEQRKAKRKAEQQGMELLPGPPERRVRQYPPGYRQDWVYYIWPVCKVVELEEEQ
jgi:hypothetical protein